MMVRTIGASGTHLRMENLVGRGFLLNRTEKFLLAEIFKFKALKENGVWYIDGEPIEDTVKVIDALFERKQVTFIANP